MAQSQRSVRQNVNDLETKEGEKAAFFELAERLTNTFDHAEQKRLKEELARLTLGEP